MKAPAKPIKTQQHGLFDLGGDVLGEQLKKAVLDCIAIQKTAATEARSRYIPDANALDKVSAEALDKLLAGDVNVHGLATERTLSNGICFCASHIEGAVNDPAVYQAREALDELVKIKVAELFDTWRGLAVTYSGVFWYPPDCAMGWHTNSKAPGWRIYINYAEQPGQSFFRYRDPSSRELITLDDQQWNLRAFRITDNDPLWHCIYSATNRFSFGFRIQEKSALKTVARKTLSILRH